MYTNPSQMSRASNMSQPSQESVQSASFFTALSHISASNSHGSSTQIESRAIIAAAKAVELRKFTLTPSQPGFGSSTQIGSRIIAYEAARALEREREAQRLVKGPTIEDITPILGRALSSVPDARLIVASAHFPDDTNQNSSIIPLQCKAKDRVIFGVIQQPQDADLAMRLPLTDRSTLDSIECRIIYDPAGDDCLLANSGELDLCLTMINSSPPTSVIVEQRENRLIKPGMWRISATGDTESTDTEECHLAEFWLRERQFEVTIRRAKWSLQGKRIAEDDAEVNPTKRQKRKRNKDLKETATILSTDKTAIEPRSVTARTESIDAHNSALSLPIRRIIDKTAVPLLDLADGETAVIQARRDRKNISRPASMAKGLASYQLQRVKKIANTKSASIFTCQHSAMPELIVAKVLQHNKNSSYNLVSLSTLWKREKATLEILKHRNVISLKAFDGCMLALYLELLPPSLCIGEGLRLEFSNIYRILYDISSALIYLKTIPIIHNDIKPDNIAYSPQRGAVLIDFALATRYNESSAGGTQHYLPPDLFDYRSRGAAGDVWALGITMLQLLGKIRDPAKEINWPIREVCDKAESPNRMEKWFRHISTIRSTLNRCNVGCGRVRLEHVVFKMLERDGERRIKAEDIMLLLDPPSAVLPVS